MAIAKAQMIRGMYFPAEIVADAFETARRNGVAYITINARNTAIRVGDAHPGSWMVPVYTMNMRGELARV
jgi:hypothetical protein